MSLPFGFEHVGSKPSHMTSIHHTGFHVFIPRPQSDEALCPPAPLFVHKRTHDPPRQCFAPESLPVHLTLPMECADGKVPQRNDRDFPSTVPMF